MVYRSQWIVGRRALEIVGSVMRVREDEWKGPWMEIEQQEYDWLAEQPEHAFTSKGWLDNRATSGWLKDKATSPNLT